ncbi:MAG: putative secreted protein [Myxococcaceae bacterium]|nr:putative secreted protein [Myxococcaceae bacterium]
MPRLRVLSLNLWHKEAPWEQRREVIRRGLRALDPDIIGLQEVLELRLGEHKQNQAEELLRDLGYHYVFGAAQVLGAGFELGNAIASKYPLHGHQVTPLPRGESSDTRSVIDVRVETPHGDVPVFVTHLNWKLHHGSVRIRQVRTLVDLIEQRAPIGETFAPILMGDFNAEPESDEIRFLRGFATLRGESDPPDGKSVFFADAWAYGGDGSAGFTFDRRNPYAARSHEPPRRIDYIFVRGPDAKWRGEPLTTRVVFDQPEDGIWASDHFGLYTELSTEAETPAWVPTEL